MPTGLDFQRAAAEFEAVSGELRGLAAEVRSIDVADVLQGGSLGRRVPERLTVCAEQAAGAANAIDGAAHTCRERAAIIAAYEAKLVAYEFAMAAYEAQVNSYSLASSGWGSFFAGTNDTPVLETVRAPLPRRPIPPSPPPAWADVRRP